MKKFGGVNLAITETSQRVPVPIGKFCSYCEEPFLAEDAGIMLPHHGKKVVDHPYHQNCFLRTVLGSVGHQQGDCSCHGGTDEDPLNLTKRQAADAAVHHFRGKRDDEQ